jgi:hypothetical protein
LKTGFSSGGGIACDLKIVRPGFFEFDQLVGEPIKKIDFRSRVEWRSVKRQGIASWNCCFQHQPDIAIAEAFCQVIDRERHRV